MCQDLTPEQLRKINLFEVLFADAEGRGQTIEEPAVADVLRWSEEDICRFFLPADRQPVYKTPAGAVPRFPPAHEEDFKKWFPGLALSKTQCTAPRFRVLCFPNAGNAEDMYTSEGTGSRRMPSPLLEWCRANKAECLAVQPPGRNMRRNEQPYTTPQALAKALLPVVASQLIHVPYAVVGHSVGTWVAYEFLMLARKQGLPMPRIIFFSAMASPDLGVDVRPWHRQSDLSEEAFKAECRGWDVNEVVFSPALWGTYHLMMRADFTLFDSYAYEHQGSAPLPCPLVTFYGMQDRRISQTMVEGWKQFSSAAFELHAIDGHHLWPLQNGPKLCWLESVVQHLAQISF